MIKQLQLCTKQGNGICTKQGNGICTSCSGIYKSTVHCPHTIANDYNFQLEILNDMMDLFLRYTHEFNSKAEILDYLDARELEENSK